MKAYLFLSVHPKFEVKIPIDRSEPTSKNSYSLANEEFRNGEICDEPNMSLLQ